MLRVLASGVGHADPPWLVLAVSTGIRAQGHLWALPEHPECPILASLSGVRFGTWNNGKLVPSP